MTYIISQPFFCRTVKAFSDLLPIVNHFYLAFSGGLDSSILLNFAKQCVPKEKLTAIHINHQWHKNNLQWEQHCQTVCRKMHIAFIARRMDKKLQSKTYLKTAKGPEEAARTLRYQILREHLQINDCLLLGHHMEDQSETLFLQLLRGSGVEGLSSMPFLIKRNHVYYFRPLLHWTKDKRLDYAKTYHLQWIEDSSNADTNYNRNFLRHQILPSLKKRWPQLTRTSSRTTQHCADAMHLLHEIAQEDCQKIVLAGLPLQLCLEKFLILSLPRQKNMLRHWLKQVTHFSVNTFQLQEILKLLRPTITHTNFYFRQFILKRYRNRLYLLTNQDIEPFKPQNMLWNFIQPLHILNCGTLTIKKVKGTGLSLAKLSNTKILDISFRKGGERLHSTDRIGSHPLKKLFQEWNVVPWRRAYFPLIYHQDVLVAVPNYAYEKKYAATQNESGIVIEFHHTTYF